jgi:Fe-S-cluster containining protein
MMNRAERRRLAKADEKLLISGIDLSGNVRQSAMSMARLLNSKIETAKGSGDIDEFVGLLYSKINSIIKKLNDIPVACGKGCSHCCHVFVTASTPEIIYISKIVRRLGEDVIAKVRTAYIETKNYDFDARLQQSRACPLLEGDFCSVYESRPKACRTEASMDASICAASYINLTDDIILKPAIYMKGRAIFEIALAMALRHAQLPLHAYEFNAGLAIALERTDAEKAWLSGEDVLAGARRDPEDTFEAPGVNEMYGETFRD